MKTLGQTKKARGERGNSLVVVLGVVMVLAGAAAASLSVSNQRIVRQKRSATLQKALAAAESGLDQAIALSNSGQFDNLGENQSMPLTASTILGATTGVTVKRLANSVNGNATTITLRVTSTGTAGSDTRKVVGFIRKVVTSVALTANIPNVEAAIMLSDPFADINFNGNSFLINGDNRNINSNTNIPNQSVWGLAVGPQSNGQPGSTAGIVSQISNQQTDNVQGTGGDPSVGNSGSVAISNIISSMAPYAQVTLVNPGTYNNNLGTYTSQTVNSPQLTSVVGDIHISGNGQGCGVLLVNGNLTVTGNWSYIGLIFVNGQVTFSGGGNTKKVQGAVFVAGNVQDLNVSGNITVQYSSQAISLITTWLSSTFNSSTSTPYYFVSSAETQ